jgi:hypothetical protein
MEEIKDGVQGGNVTINVYASDGMDVNRLASLVQQKLVNAQKQRNKAWAI